MPLLIVDTDVDFLNSTKDLLTSKGYNSIQSNAIPHAIKQLESNSSINLIICDTELKDQNGKDLLDFLNSNFRFKSIPVLVCSTFQSQEQIVGCLKKGAKDVMAKPVNSDSLIQRIEQIIKSGKGTVLIVDDEQFIVEILETTLMREGFTTLSANNGLQALNVLEKERVDAIISDILMPEMNGMELLANVKDKYPSVPVLIITGFSNKYSKDNILAEGADGYITKPFKNIEIVNKVKSLL
ncbi:MAG: response regulator [candidate division Zixibacteria bacterium]|nr:response regulator [candidate division Zixibacteria bacterium]